MSLEPELHDQARQLFFHEALELLEQIQQGLSDLQHHSNISQLNSLIRAVGTLKSGAAQLNLSDIHTLAHRFENILSFLRQTVSEINAELAEQLQQAHRCLHLTLMARLTMTRRDTLGFLAEAEFVLTRLEDLLNQSPSGSELPTALESEGDGIDVMETILNHDVVQALEQLEVSLNKSNAPKILEDITTEIEVLLSLGELLEISEFIAIAQIALASLQASPQTARTIGLLALNDFRAALVAWHRSKTTQRADLLPSSDENEIIPLDITLEEILNEPILSLDLEEQSGDRELESPVQPIASMGANLPNVEAVPLTAASEVTLKTTKLFIWQANFTILSLPYDNIEEYLIPKTDQLIQSEQQQFLAWREQTIPLYQLSQLLNFYGFFPHTGQTQTSTKIFSPSDRRSPILVVKLDSLLLALEVVIEKLITEPELIIQTFGETSASDSYFLGCTTSSENRLLPAIDVVVLLATTIAQTQTFSTTTLSNLLNVAIADKIAASQAALSQTSEHLPTILVVEDSLTWRQFLVFTLQKAGYRVLQARDGQEGLKQLQQNSTIRLIVTDLEMPNLNGFGFLICCRQDPKLAKVPVVILSNYSSEQHRQLTMQLGADAYFSKPYDEPEFLVAISSLIVSNRLKNSF